MKAEYGSEHNSEQVKWLARYLHGYAIYVARHRHSQIPFFKNRTLELEGRSFILLETLLKMHTTICLLAHLQFIFNFFNCFSPWSQCHHLPPTLGDAAPPLTEKRTPDMKIKGSSSTSRFTAYNVRKGILPH